MFRNVFQITLFMVITMVGFQSCKKEEDPKPQEATVDILVSASQAGPFSYFSFEKGAVVTDANVFSTKDWDFGLKLVSFQVNGGQDRTGQGGVIILDKTFENVTTAPESGYKTDNGADTAIKDEWYIYDPVARSFTPKAGKIFVFKTGKGNYAKMEVLAGVPTDDNGVKVNPPTLPTKIKYTIRFAYQTDGSRNF